MIILSPSGNCLNQSRIRAKPLLCLVALPGLVFSQDQPGRIEAVAGVLHNYDEQPAVESVLQAPRRVLSAGPGGFYFTEPNGRVYRVDPEGTLRFFAAVVWPSSWVDSDPTGTYWYANGTGIRRVATDGTDTSYLNFSNDPPLNALLERPSAMGCFDGYCYLTNSMGVFKVPGPVTLSEFFAARNARRLSAKRTDGLLAIDAVGLRVYGPGTGAVLAGSGEFGVPIEGQPAAEARFQSLTDVVEDTQGRILVADAGNRAVYRVDQGKIEQVAGSTDAGGEPAEQGVIARSARFQSVDSIAVDAAGRLLIADPFAFMVWAVGEDGLLSRVAGRRHIIRASPVESELSDPGGVAYDADGNLYIVDRLAFRIHMLGADGTWEAVAGSGARASSGDRGPAVDAAIQPTGPIAAGADGFVYFIDANTAIRRFRRGGNIETWLTREQVGVDALYGMAGNGRGEFALRVPTGLYRVAGNRQAQPIDLSPVTRGNPFAPSTFALLDDGSVVFPWSGGLIQLTPSGEVNPFGRTSDSFACSNSLAILSGAGDEVLSSSGSAICRFSPGGARLLAGGSSQAQPAIADGGPARSGSLSGVSALAAGPSGSVAFTERLTNRVRRFVP